MKIRKVKTDEWSDLQRLNNEVFLDNAQYDSDIIVDWALSEAGKKYFQEVAKSEEGICLIGETDDGELVGYLAASPKPFDYRKSKYLEVDNMGVMPKYRSQGIGKQLIEACKSWARDNGFQKVFVTSYFHNQKAVSFYKSCGFDEIDVSLECQLTEEGV